MNKNLVIGGIIVLILIGAGIMYSTKKGDEISDITPTPTPVVTVDNSNTTTSPQATAPTAVTSSSVLASDTTAIVTGTVNPKGALASYWYEYGTASNNLGSKTKTQTVGSGFVSTQAPGYITNLAKNTTYYFRLVAENQNGRVAGGQQTFKTTEGNPAPVGSAPISKTLAASGISKTTANLNGEVTPNKAATYYWFEYGKTAQLGNTSAYASVGDGSTKVPVSITLSDLDPVTTYYFRLNAQNQFGTINGSILNFKTAGPAAATAPEAVTKPATGISTSDATLHGSVNPNGAETKYWFEYSTDSLLGSVLLSVTDQATISANSNDTNVKADISDLSPKTNYYFRLVAQNSQGTTRGDKVTFKTR